MTMLAAEVYWGDGEYKRVLIPMENIGGIVEKNKGTVVLWLKVPMGGRKCLEIRESFDAFMSSLE